jgi:hypothetical protein
MKNGEIGGLKAYDLTANIIPKEKVPFIMKVNKW